MKTIAIKSGKLFVGSVNDAVKLCEGKTKQKFDIIWNLARELKYLINQQEKIAARVLHADIEDGNIPNWQVEQCKFHAQLVNVKDILFEGGSVFIHCMGGQGRTGTIAALIKREIDGVEAEKAIEEIASACNGGPETEEQKKFVRSYSFSPSIPLYHCHFYFDSVNETVLEFHKYLELGSKKFRDNSVKIGKIHEKPVGPHPKPQFVMAFEWKRINQVMELIVLRPNEFTALIHPITNDGYEIKDHTERAMWVGDKLQLNIDTLERHKKD